MNGPKPAWSYSGSGKNVSHWEEQNRNNSTVSKMQHKYWLTKQTVFEKLGKKEDECIVAADAELDAKLELFRSIQDNCLQLQHIIDRYEKSICTLAQEENAMGRFLKDAGKHDKTRAGKMMNAVGKSMSYSGQQRLALRTPLHRLNQEVETFRNRAIVDTLMNVKAMEETRRDYRATLNWMKNVSTELDPDTDKQLEKFRKVQEHVKRSRSSFERQKLDCLQKVDLLAAARCNMFSHALILYQQMLLQFTEKSVEAFTTVANSFKGNQKYDFCVVKELAELKPEEIEVEQTNVAEEDDDKLLEFDEDDCSKTGDLLSKGDSEVGSKAEIESDARQTVGENGKVSHNSTLLADLISCSNTNNDFLLPSQLLMQQTTDFESFKDSSKSVMDSQAGLANQGEKSPWWNLFSELDPLANPDAVGKSKSEADRNC
ncbi:islet cell autoantigen 1 [Nilaparvata lugens]|uniref:islet cell autoantigen 1 n=1 Tax=Nilaparvata lugens TaxID=108931 RepID=UPI00193DAF61|nr:islet cell autoantigen 1 [Nilaparvata lugens]